MEPGDWSSSPCPATTVLDLDKSFEFPGPHTLSNGVEVHVEWVLGEVHPSLLTLYASKVVARAST